MARVRAPDRPRPWGELSVVLTDDAGIRRVNRAFLDRDRPTDVISFCFDPMPGDDDRCSGEVFVNVERALERGPGASRELALYLAHGCDHLSGASDADAAGRRRMRRRELGWLRRPENAVLKDELI